MDGGPIWLILEDGWGMGMGCDEKKRVCRWCGAEMPVID